MIELDAISTLITGIIREVAKSCRDSLSKETSHSVVNTCSYLELFVCATHVPQVYTHSKGCMETQMNWTRKVNHSCRNNYVIVVHHQSSFKMPHVRACASCFSKLHNGLLCCENCHVRRSDGNLNLLRQGCCTIEVHACIVVVFERAGAPVHFLLCKGHPMRQL